MPEKISCQNCDAACCKGPMTMELTAPEMVFMRRGGTKLKTIAYPDSQSQPAVTYPIGFTLDQENLIIVGMEGPPDDVPAGKGRFVLLGRCGYLAVNSEGWEYCSAYEKRPQVCRDFEMGGQTCATMRDQPELEAYVEIKLRQGQA